MNMGLFGAGKPTRVVVKEYGRDFIFAFALNPIMIALMVRFVGMEPLIARRLEAQTRAMENDARDGQTRIPRRLSA